MPCPTGSLLIVDDEIDIQEILAEVLSETALSIQTSSNGGEALEMIKAGSFDAVLSDINMPDMNGLELLFKVRESSLEVPFVFLTGFASKERAVDALRLGATDFLEKPFAAELVVDVMGKALALGVAMKEVALETDKLFKSTGITAEQRRRLQSMKKSVMTMKRMAGIYMKAS